MRLAESGYPVADVIEEGGVERPVLELRREAIDFIYRRSRGLVVIGHETDGYKTDRVSPEAEWAVGLGDRLGANQMRVYGEAQRQSRSRQAGASAAYGSRMSSGRS